MAFFKSGFESGFQQAGFQVLVSSLNKFSFIRKVSGLFCRVAKIGFKVLGQVLVSVGFDWLCFVALVFVRGRFCRFSKLACFLLAKFRVS